MGAGWDPCLEQSTVVDFKRSRRLVRGSPVRIRRCPATVCRARGVGAVARRPDSTSRITEPVAQTQHQPPWSAVTSPRTSSGGSWSPVERRGQCRLRGPFRGTRVTKTSDTANPGRRVGPIMTRSAVLALVFALLAAFLTPSATAAVEDGSATSAWLAAQVSPDGSVLDPYTSEPSVDWSVNVALALATTSGQTEALNRAMRHIETNAEEYIISGTSDPAGHISWLAILAVATGRDPRAFGPTSINLVDRLIARYGVTENGLFGTVDEYTPVINQSLSVIALIAAGEGIYEAAIDWLLSQQCEGPSGHSGAWQGHRGVGLPGSLVDCLTTSSASYARPESGSTSYAVQALTAVRASVACSPRRELRSEALVSTWGIRLTRTRQLLSSLR